MLFSAAVIKRRPLPPKAKRTLAGLPRRSRRDDDLAEGLGIES